MTDKSQITSLDVESPATVGNIDLTQELPRIYLSAPDVRPAEKEFLIAAVESNWIAPIGPELTRFEEELAAVSDRKFCVGLSSATAGLQLSLLAAGVGPGDVVLCSTFTFVASANAIHHVGATPHFIDSEESSWNIDPGLLETTISAMATTGELPAAVVTVDLYGQCADYTRIKEICARFDVPLIEDAAEGLGASHNGRPAGSFGQSAVFSFNGNKIITASGGGALVTDDENVANRVLHLATQARDPAPYYEHTERGFNFRLSNLLAAFGRGQLQTLPERVARRRHFNSLYRDLFEGIPGVSFMSEAEGNFTTFWLTTLTLEPGVAPVSAEDLRLKLETHNIESRPVWKPMHLQPAYKAEPATLNGVSDSLFANGICLPSGSGMTDSEFERVLDAVGSELGVRV